MKNLLEKVFSTLRGKKVSDIEAYFDLKTQLIEIEKKRNELRRERKRINEELDSLQKLNSSVLSKVVSRKDSRFKRGLDN